MRISALVNRIWGDIAAQPVAVGLLAAVIVAVVFLAAVGLVVIARRIEAWVNAGLDRSAWRRSTATDGPLEPVDAEDDDEVWAQQLPPHPENPVLRPGRMRCGPTARRRLWSQINTVLAQQSEDA